MRLLLTVIFAVLAAGSAHATCYQIFKEGRLVYQDTILPFDIAYASESGPSAAMRASQARGEQLVFFEDQCVALHTGNFTVSNAPTLAVDLARVGAATPAEIIVQPLSRDVSSRLLATQGGYSGFSGGKSAAGTDVNVRGYTRKDGTRVRPHTRSAPGRKSSRK